eukprot:52781-Hanusia_phi.AAC.1
MAREQTGFPMGRRARASTILRDSHEGFINQLLRYTPASPRNRTGPDTASLSGQHFPSRPRRMAAPPAP